MPHERVTLRAPAGDCPAHVFTPQGAGPWPAVIMFMDGFGIRPTLFDLAQRTADGGYLILLPDLFYRIGSYEPLDLKSVFASPDIRKHVEAILGRPTTPQLALEDTSAFLAYLRTRSDIAGEGVGTIGYCMGGAIALAAAGLYPGEVVAAASFHGGNLATESDVSPHRLAPAMRAQIYVAGAENDPSYPPEMAERLEQALTAARVPHHCEIYQGAVHGWTMPDTPRFNREATERHWRELLLFFATALRRNV